MPRALDPRQSVGRHQWAGSFTYVYVYIIYTVLLASFKRPVVFRFTRTNRELNAFVRLPCDSPDDEWTYMLHTLSRGSHLFFRERGRGREKTYILNTLSRESHLFFRERWGERGWSSILTIFFLHFISSYPQTGITNGEFYVSQCADPRGVGEPTNYFMPVAVRV